nr:immunoglobulin heavy chain junction region [Macaca mulatta]
CAKYCSGIYYFGVGFDSW